MDACDIRVTGGEISPEEALAYKKRALDLYGRMPFAIDVKVDGDEVELRYHFTWRPAITRSFRGTLELFDEDCIAAHERLEGGDGL